MKEKSYTGWGSGFTSEGGEFFKEHWLKMVIVLVVIVLGLGAWWAIGAVNNIRAERDAAVLGKSQADSSLRKAEAEIAGLSAEISNLKKEVNGLKEAEAARQKAQIELAGMQNLGIVNVSSPRIVLARFVKKEHKEKGERVTARQSNAEAKRWAVKLGLLDPKTGRELGLYKKVFNKMALVPVRGETGAPLAVYLKMADGRFFSEPYAVINPGEYRENGLMFFQYIRKDAWSDKCPGGMSDAQYSEFSDLCSDLKDYAGG